MFKYSVKKGWKGICENKVDKVGKWNKKKKFPDEIKKR